MPSGAKKRKTAKRRKEKKQRQQPGPPHPPPGDGEREEEDDLTSQESKGSESSSGLPSPTARDENQHRLEVEEDEEPAESGVEAEGEEKSKKERETSVMVDAVDVMESTENGGSEQPSESLAPQKTEGEVKSEAEVPVAVVEVEKDDTPLPLPSDPIPPTSTEVPISKLEEVSVEHLQSEKGKEVAVSEDSPPSIERKQSDAVDTASPVELSVPISEEVVQASDIPVEGLEVVESVAESLSNKNEEKVVSLADTATEQQDTGIDSHPHTEPREIAGTTKVARPTQLQQRTSWMSCCGLFDVITGANR